MYWREKDGVSDFCNWILKDSLGESENDHCGNLENVFGFSSQTQPALCSVFNNKLYRENNVDILSTS